MTKPECALPYQYCSRSDWLQLRSEVAFLTFCPTYMKITRAITKQVFELHDNFEWCTIVHEPQ